MMQVPRREGDWNAVHLSAWLPGCLRSCSAEYHCSAFSGSNVLHWFGALSLFITHSCVSAGGEECRVACQPVLLDCQRNKRNGNSPLERQKEREKEAHWDTEEEKPCIRRGDALQHSHMLGLCAKAEGCRSGNSKLLGSGCNYCSWTPSSGRLEEAIYYLCIEHSSSAKTGSANTPLFSILETCIFSTLNTIKTLCYYR